MQLDDVNDILAHLTEVEASLQNVVIEHQDGKYGFLTREYGFTAPGGLGGQLGGKFKPWEEKLERVKDFFWPVEAYDAMEEHPHGKADPNVIQKLGLAPEGEQIYGNIPLHNFLKAKPEQEVTLEEATDLHDYRTAARIFLLLGTLSHLYGNSAPDRTSHTLPPWIEEPLLVVAKRLDIEPTLSGHFLVMENWLWKHTTTEDSYARLSKESAKRRDLVIVRTLLDQCECDDRRYRLKIYPDCFIGSQAIDVFMDNGFAQTREEACRMGRRVNEKFKLFTHVTNDHPLMDKHFFYRFRSKWHKKKVNAESTGEDVDDEEVVEVDPDELSFPTSRLMRPSDLLRSTSISRMNSTRSIHNLSKKASSFREMWQHSCGDSSFWDVPSNRSFHPRLDADESAPNEEKKVADDHPLVEGPNATIPSLTRNCLAVHDEASETQKAVSTIAVMAKVEVKDRRYRLRTYKQCFVASQMIDVLMANDCASSREEAVQLARFINQRYGPIFEHVVDDHVIKDEYLFFRFTKNNRNLMSVDSEGLQHISSNLSLDSRGLSPHKPTGRSDSWGPPKQQTPNENLWSEKLVDACPSDSVGAAFDGLRGFDEADEFRIDNIDMLYPAFGHNHEKINQLVPACMGHAFASLPFDVIEIITTMRNMLEAAPSANSDLSRVDSLESQRLYNLLFKVAFSVSRCKEAFQQMSTDPMSRTFNSKHISIRHTQPISNGVVVNGKRRKGTTGTQFPYFHLLDWLLGRHHYGDSSTGLVAQIAELDDTYTRPEREFIASLAKLKKPATLRGFLDVVGRPPKLLTAFNHLIECYAGEGGVLQAHSRKLYSYIHNDVQFSTSGTNHLEANGEKGYTTTTSAIASNHNFARMMFKHMRRAADDRWGLRIAPLMTEVSKVVYSTSVSGGFTTVALDLSDTGLQYEYGDVVKCILPNCDRTTFAWSTSLSSNAQEYFTLKEMQALHKDTGNGWGWTQLWEQLGWCRFEEGGGKGVPLELISRYIEQGEIRVESSANRWVNCPLELCNDGKNHCLFPVPPPLTLEQIASLEPVSPRIYSVSGVESDRVFLLVSKPQDGASHHGYQAMCNPKIEQVHRSFSPATFFLVPPNGVNLLCVASGTGISPFVGLADTIGSRHGSYTIAHQCKSSDLFLANSQTWLDFTFANPGAVVMGYISGDRSRRNCPMRYIIRNGAFEETTVLRRHDVSSYYFQCELFQGRVKETYQQGGLNLAYCCGGVESAILPLKEIAAKEGFRFEFTTESYTVSPKLKKVGRALQVGGTIVDMDEVGSVHPGGPAILEQLNDVALETQDSQTPDLSIAFYELHPHAYNLHRCLGTPKM